MHSDHVGAEEHDASSCPRLAPPWSMVTIGLLLLVGCDARGAWDARASEIRASARARVDAIALTSSPPGASFEPVLPDVTRILVSETEVVLDRSPMRATYPEGGDALARALALPPSLVTIARIDADHIVLEGDTDDEGHPTEAVLGRAIEMLSFRPVELRHVTLYVDRALPAATLAQLTRVLAEWVSPVHAWLALAGPHGPVSAPLLLRRLVYDQNAHLADAEMDGLALELALEPEGVVVRTSSGRAALGCAAIGVDQPIAVPARSGVLDGAGLVACVDRIMADAPNVDVAYLRVDHASLDDVAAALGALSLGSRPWLRVVLTHAPLARPPIDTSLADVLRMGAVTGTRADLVSPRDP